MEENNREEQHNEPAFSIDPKQSGGEADSPEPTKRKRGGQPGNRNARKHGFYSQRLSPEEINVFLELLSTEKMEIQEAIFNVKLKTLLETDPGNVRARNELSYRIAEYNRFKTGLGKKESKVVRELVTALLEKVFQAAAPENKPELRNL